MGLATPERLLLDAFLAAGPRRDPVTMKDQAKLALVYFLRAESGEANPARALAARYPGTSEKTWVNRFHRLRSLDLLTPAPRRGVAGGTLTDRSMRLLAGDPFSPKLNATYEANRSQSLKLTDDQRFELAGIADWEVLKWLADNPTVGVDDPDDWLNRKIEAGEATSGGA